VQFSGVASTLNFQAAIPQLILKSILSALGVFITLLSVQERALFPWQSFMLKSSLRPGNLPLQEAIYAKDNHPLADLHFAACVFADRARYEATFELLNKTHSRASPSSVAAAVNPLDEVIATKVRKHFFRLQLKLKERGK